MFVCRLAGYQSRVGSRLVGGGAQSAVVIYRSTYELGGGSLH